MTLEDFFTLTEMKDGLTAPARVKELINVMQKDNHNVLKNVNDASRQWSTVARTIAATESKDCLALFLQLDGIYFFDTWLKEGQKVFKETGDSFVEESITVLLGAIEKLLIDGKKSITSGIMMTIKDLLSTKSSRVQDRAKALFDSCKQNNESNEVHKDIEKDEGICDDLVDVYGNSAGEQEQPENSSQHIVERASDEMMPAISAENMQPNEVVGLTTGPSNKTTGHASVQDVFTDPVLQSDTSRLISENNSVLERAPAHQSEATMGVESSGSAVPEQRMFDGQLDVANSKVDDGAKEMPPIRGCNKPSATDNSFGAASTNTLESKVSADIEKDVAAEKEDPCPNMLSSGDVRKEGSEGKDEIVNTTSPNPSIKTSTSDSTAPVDILQDSSISEHNLGKKEDPATNTSSKEDTEAIEESKDQNDTTDEDDDDDEVDLGNNYDFSMSGVDVKDSVDKKSDFELDYGAFDPLEVARQVAIEVEREVDCREPSCSSSEQMSGGGVRPPESPDSLHGKKNRELRRSFNDVSTGPNLSVVGDKDLVKAKNLPSEKEHCVVDTEPSGFTNVAQKKTEPEEDNLGCGFDLNEVVLSDDMDHQINPVTAPISVVSASRAPAASGLPLSPLQFEGTLGWKGSAEFSAFRPAPTRKIGEGENSMFASGSGSNLFQRHDFLNFDLNVAESEDDKNKDLPVSKEIPNLTVQSFGNCSIEASPKRSDLLQLDLNQVSDGGDAPLPYWRKDARVLPHWNGQFSPSTSSSSSSIQPTLKNIDLNDQPSLFTEFMDPGLAGKSSPNVSASGSGGFKPDKSVISLMGARVEVNRNDIISQAVPSSNGRMVDHAPDVSLTRNDGMMGLGSSSLYPQPSMYGYNGPSSGPTAPFPSAMYGLGGQIPYMVDSRGSPVLPQVLGSMPALPPPNSQPSFFMSLGATPSEPNRYLPFRHGLDLNSGLMIEGANRDAGSARQLFNPGHGISIDEQMRANSQSTSSSGVGGKRKETDGGWEPYPFNYKHTQPPWK